MYITSNENTKKFFKPEKLIRKFNRYKTHDQTYIIANKNKFTYSMLHWMIFLMVLIIINITKILIHT